LVSPEEMMPERDPDDYYLFTAEGGKFFIQKEFLDSADEQEFILTHLGRYKIAKTRDAIIIR
jgi:hypothetical protein